MTSATTFSPCHTGDIFYHLLVYCYQVMPAVVSKNALGGVVTLSFRLLYSIHWYLPATKHVNGSCETFSSYDWSQLMCVGTLYAKKCLWTCPWLEKKRMRANTILNKELSLKDMVTLSNFLLAIISTTNC